MSQSGFIVGALVAAFVLFLAARGRLPIYAGVLWGAGSPSTGGTVPPRDNTTNNADTSNSSNASRSDGEWFDEVSGFVEDFLSSGGSTAGPNG